ncbi:Uncharacterized membrane protein YheB, UPF0754 family [Desulfurobacterium pacificum]|uniref:Uncharacterized membrane protein YheB, UPF0754 family n=1 Tax=Desulfurobacterium pacificum TaxID=240166 RepID=A0ABY1NDV3_9BACT|nr:DUF445 family protein [Desulfurobacterium pacificum]SMP07232.1 Uncharacterized membrane protein YheB, UPF0754 family [Desulfurobacterium pacificum]
MIEYLLPPIAGGIIGYFTNYVAIKMLFRPVKPYYLFGRKLPLTPGLIPSKREKLAEAIAKVVKENLITEEVVKKRLNEEKIYLSLKELIERFIDRFSENSEEYFQEFLAHIDNKPFKEFGNFPQIEESLKTFMDSIFRSLEGKTLNELIPSSLKRDLESFIDKKSEEIASYIVQLVKDKEFESIVYSFIDSALERLLAHVPFLPQNFKSSVAEKLGDAIVKNLRSLADDPALQSKISKLVWKKFQSVLNTKIDTNSRAFTEFRSFLNSLLDKYLNVLSEKTINDLPVLKEKILPHLYTLTVRFIQSEKETISSMAAEKLLKIIEEELPVILESIDIESMVKERVNALPVEEVEGLILKLINEELNYITLLGGVLGFIIGLFQSFVFYFLQ